MPRRRVPTRISDPHARLVAGRMIFAAAAEALGGVYGTTAMERVLAFSPRARAERKSYQFGSGLPPVKRSLPTGTCKKWLGGHVPIDQTLILIAKLHPNVADRMLQARDSDIVKALTVARYNYSFVGSRIAVLSPEMFGEYLGGIALGHCNPDFVSRLAAGLLRLAMAEADVLAAIIGADRQLPFACGSAAAMSLDEAFDLALSRAAATHAEIAFSRAALADAWSHRKAERARIEGRQTMPQKFVTDIEQTAQVRDQICANWALLPHIPP
jgi:hypothetical protein